MLELQMLLVIKEFFQLNIIQYCFLFRYPLIFFPHPLKYFYRFDPLIQTLLDCTHSSSVVLISFKKRRKADKRFFIKLKKHFIVEEIKNDPQRPHYSQNSLYIFEATRKGPNK